MEFQVPLCGGAQFFWNSPLPVVNPEGRRESKCSISDCYLKIITIFFSEKIKHLEANFLRNSTKNEIKISAKMTSQFLQVKRLSYQSKQCFAHFDR